MSDIKSSENEVKISSQTEVEAKEKTEKVSGLCRVFNPPKLEKKHSSGDLISRLKTRKILGVGETDGGDVHRSKISQVLGHNEHLYMKLPRGFWMAHIFLGMEITLEALLYLVAPSFAESFFIFPSKINDQIGLVSTTRTTGAVLCGLLVFIWSFIGTNEKQNARALLSALLTYHFICFLLIFAEGYYHEEGFWRSGIRLNVCLRMFYCFLCSGYLYSIATFVPIRGNRFSHNSRCQESKER